MYALAFMKPATARPMDTTAADTAAPMPTAALVKVFRLTPLLIRF